MGVEYVRYEVRILSNLIILADEYCRFLLVFRQHTQNSVVIPILCDIKWSCMIKLSTYNPPCFYSIIYEYDHHRYVYETIDVRSGIVYSKRLLLALRFYLVNR